MEQFLSGAASMGFFVAGLFFLKFWRKTNDRLFISFTIAFWLMAVNQLVLSFLDRTDEARTWVYVVRFFAFSVIIFAILDKNIFSVFKSKNQKF
jgi:hypothetical protein